MNSKPFTFLLLLSVLFLRSTAQSISHYISGSVFDSVMNKPIEFASVSISYPDSSQILASASTDSNGRFTLTNISPGKYSLTSSLIGYEKRVQPIEVSKDKTETRISHILLHSLSKELGETVILSEKPVIKFEPGKIVFDVAKTMTDGAETALEAMQKIPGVTVTQNNTVEVKGKSGVKYLVDGKPSPLAQSNPEAFLRSIPAKNIESIEVVTTPSAKYDASGSAAIINIHLKKGKLEGLNGSVSAGVGTVFDKYNASGNINYKKGKINVFATAYFRDEQMTSSTYENRRVTVNDTNSYYVSKGNGASHSRSGSGKAGIEYSIDKYNSVTYSLDADYWQWGNTKNSVMSVNDLNAPTLSQRQSNTQGLSKDLSITNSLNYRRTFDSSDRAWTIDLAHTMQNQDSRNQTLSRSYDNLSNELMSLDFYNRSRNHGTNHNILLQTDYTTPFTIKDSKIETGLKEELNLHNTTNDVYSNINNTELRDSMLSSLFKYTESITAVYFTYSGKIKKLSYSGGIRWEQTYVHSDFSGVNQSYGDLFPSANLGWQFNENHNINLSYSRRIDRPGFWMLNNSSIYGPYSVWSGNPQIKAAYSNALELGYSAQIKKQSLNFTVNYSRQDGAFQEINRTLANHITYSHYENAGTEDDAYAGVNFSLKMTKWWEGSIYTGYSYSWFSYMQDGVSITNKGGSLNVSGNTTFKFWKTASLAFWGWGNTGWVSAQQRYKPVGSLTVTLKKKFFKDKLTISLSCRDIFQSMRWRSTTSAAGLVDTSEYRSASRVGYLTLTYQFGSQSFTPETKGKSSRMGGGGGGGGGK
jgi:hypothetical protein